MSKSAMRAIYYKQILKNKNYRKIARTRYNGMRDRCYNKNSFAYRYYGERGIRVCEEWQDFNSFWQWLQIELAKKAHRYSSLKQAIADLEIDRINPNGDYSPDNCRLLPMATNAITQHQERICIYYKDHFIPLWAFDIVFYDTTEDKVFKRIMSALRTGYSNKTICQLTLKDKVSTLFDITMPLGGYVYYRLDKPPLFFEKGNRVAECPLCKSHSVILQRHDAKRRRYVATCKECDFEVVLVNEDKLFYIEHSADNLIKKPTDTKMLEILSAKMPQRFSLGNAKSEEKCLKEFLDFRKEFLLT